MAEITEFAHGFHYGDYSGVIFYGPPTDGFWVDRLAVSDCYISPLFRAILDRFWNETGSESTPRLVSEWNTLTGWADTGAGIVPVAAQTAEEFANALGVITPEDLAPHIAGATSEECLRCAGLIRSFICARLASQRSVYIEDD